MVDREIVCRSVEKRIAQKTVAEELECRTRRCGATVASVNSKSVTFEVLHSRSPSERSVPAQFHVFIFRAKDSRDSAGYYYYITFLLKTNKKIVQNLRIREQLDQ